MALKLIWSSSFIDLNVPLASENNWQLPQQLPDPTPLKTSLEQHYGFLDTHTGYFRHVTHVENEINELGGDVEVLPVSERRPKRIQHEEGKWDEDYYMLVAWKLLYCVSC